MRKGLFALVVTLLAISGCKRLEPAKSVSYYQDHHQEMMEKFNWCGVNDPIGDKYEECRNALTAYANWQNQEAVNTVNRWATLSKKLNKP